MASTRSHFRIGACYSLFIAVLTGLMFSSCRKSSERQDLAEDNFDQALATVSTRYGAIYDSKAVAYMDSVYHSTEKLGVAERFKFYDFYCGYNYQAKKDYLKAMTYTDSMVMIIERSNNQDEMVRQYAQAHYVKGDVYFMTGNYQEAYKYYFKSKVIATQLDKCTSSEYNYRLGMVLYKQKRFSSAADIFKMAFAEAAECKDEFGTFWRRQEVLSNVALSYAKANMPDSALIYYSEALKFLDENESRYKANRSVFTTARGVVYGNMGDIYVQKNDLAAAEELFKRSIQNNSTRLTDLADGQLTRIKLAQLYKQQNRVDDLRRILTGIKGGMDSIAHAEVTMNWNGLMSGYYIAINEPRKALEHLLTYNQLKDSLQATNQALISEDANTQLLRLETEYEIDVLKKNSRLQSLYLAVAILFTLMVLVIVFLVYKNGQRSKQSVKELKKLNDRINQQKDTLEATLASLESSSKEKDRILRAVAHDLRNPIGGIAAVSGIMMETTEDGTEQEEMLSLIQNASNDTLILINELLEAAEGGHLQLSAKQWVSVNSLLTNTADLLQFKALEKNQRIQTELADPSQKVLINREKMNRVIGNLITNAIKFSPAGADIVMKTYTSGDKVIISVADQGIGIPDHLKDRIFDMFTTAKRPGTSGEKPFGLGLYISSEIVKAHNGRLWFENNADAGVTFFIELPLG